MVADEIKTNTSYLRSWGKARATRGVTNRMTTRTGTGGAGNEIRGCERLQRALGDCYRRMPPGPGRDWACRHLNRALAECLVSAACPAECEAVRSLCSSAGTALKRSQCQEAQLSLSVCLSSLQLPS